MSDAHSKNPITHALHSINPEHFTLHYIVATRPYQKDDPRAAQHAHGVRRIAEVPYEQAEEERHVEDPLDGQQEEQKERMHKGAAKQWRKVWLAAIACLITGGMTAQVRGSV